MLLSHSDLVEEANKNYPYWNKAKYYARKEHLDERVFWGAMKLSRNCFPIVIGEDAFLLSPMVYKERILHSLDDYRETDAGASVLQSLDSLEALMDEAISSSQMEGASTTSVVAKKMLQEKRKPKDNSERMILNNYVAVRYVVENQKAELSLENLLYLHQLVTKGTLEDPSQEGKIRQDNTVVVQNSMDGEIVHVPIDHSLLANRLDGLFALFNGRAQLAENFIHPIVVGIIIHFYLSYIHPFSDGNGRTARLLFLWYLLKNGYGIMKYLSVSKMISSSRGQYETAFLETEADDLDLTYFVLNQLKTLEKAFSEWTDSLERRRKEAVMVSSLQSEQVKQRQAKLLYDFQSEAPSFLLETAVYAGKYGITLQTARTDLRDLVDKGYLEEIPVNRRKFCYRYKSET
ncbi:MAG: Fic family protein [Spirochaetales bacterium]|nr:Fic family protein [Candidatus Physcosoma equi]